MSLRFLACITQSRQGLLEGELESSFLVQVYFILASESSLNIELVRTLKQMEINCHIFFLSVCKTSKHRNIISKYEDYNPFDYIFFYRYLRKISST